MSPDEPLFYESVEKQSAYRVYGEAPTPQEAEEPTVVVEDVTAIDEKTTSVPSSGTSKVTAINLFRHPEAHPVLIDLALLRKYGIDWLGWEKETLDRRLPEDFNTPTISDVTMTKVQALKALHLVDTFWQNWEVFQMCCMALNGIFPDFEVIQAPTVPQAMVTIDIANRVRKDVPWSDEIKRYLSVIHRHDGFFCPQPPLSFVEVDTEGFPIDCEEIQRLWPSVRSTRRAPRAATITAEQLRRMLLAYEYLEESRAQLQAQLPVLRHV